MFPYYSRACETKLFDKEKSEYVNVKLYGILRGDSGKSFLYFWINVELNFFNLVSHKSGYIKPIREAFDFVERYFKEQFTDSNNKFNSTCIESLTAAKLLVELESSSVKEYFWGSTEYIYILLSFRNSFLLMKTDRLPTLLSSNRTRPKRKRCIQA